MRETHTAQASIFQTATDHEIAYELKRMSDWLVAMQHSGVFGGLLKRLYSGRGAIASNVFVQKVTLAHKSPLSVLGPADDACVLR